MSLDSVRAFLALYAPDIEILIHDGSTVNVDQDAAFVKTLSLLVGSKSAK